MTTPTSFASPQPRYVRVLSIAGSDSGGGAGIQADLKTFSALGCYGMTAITAITAQNTLGVTGIHGVPPDMLRAQIDAVAQDIGVDAVKIGMLASPEVVRVVAQAIRTHRLPHVVLDPVMVATSGAKLLADDALDALRTRLLPLATVLTPKEAEICAALGPDLKRLGLLFVGIDVIGGEYLTEINVTSHTGIVAISGFDGTNLAGQIWDAIAGKVDA